MANRKHTDNEIVEIRKTYYNGTSVVDLAEQFGVSAPTIYNYLKGSPNRKHRKLTPDQVVSILSEPLDKSTRTLATKYGVSHETIRRIRKGN